MYLLHQFLIPRLINSWHKGRWMSAVPRNSRPSAVKLAYNVYAQGKERTKYESGKIYPIIIIPGLFGSKQNWNNLAKTISSRCGRPVLTLDARNHGESEWSSDFSYDAMKDDVLALLENLQIPKANFIGHSLGGRVAMHIALSEPSYVDKLVVVDVSPVRTSPEADQLLVIVQTMKVIEFPDGIAMSAARKLADEHLKEATDNPNIRQFLVTNIREKDNSVEWRLNLEAIEVGLPELMEFEFPRTRFVGQTIFISGGSSDYVKPDQEPEIKRLFPKAVFHYIPDAGHWLHVQNPREFLSLVCPFLKSS